MELKVFAVRDVKVAAYLQPFIQSSIGGALRLFGDACGEENSPFHKHPEDFMLFEIGSYDDHSGLLTALNPTKFIGNATDFVKVDIRRDVVPAGVESAIREAVVNGKK